MRSPIEEAKALTPFWMMEIQKYDGLEIHPVRELKSDDSASNETYCEVCEPEDAHFWSIYGHLIEGGVECFDDFPNEAKARTFAQRLLEVYPNLRKHGLSG